jgi:hypothetical protein
MIRHVNRFTATRYRPWLPDDTLGLIGLLFQVAVLLLGLAVVLSS